jgi:hypothetical protein
MIEKGREEGGLLLLLLPDTNVVLCPCAVSMHAYSRCALQLAEVACSEAGLQHTLDYIQVSSSATSSPTLLLLCHCFAPWLGAGCAFDRFISQGPLGVADDAVLAEGSRGPSTSGVCD